MFESMKGKVGLVTGGAMGIGEATVRALVGMGVKVVIADWDVKAGQATTDALKKEGYEVAFVKCDISKEEDVKNMVKFTVDTFGDLDCAVNNAAVDAVPAAFHETTMESWDRVTSIDLRGTFMCMKYELAYMTKKGKGAIVNIASNAGMSGTKDIVPYGASKHGVIGLTRCACLEYAKQGIRINAVCPGIVNTPALQRVMKVRPEYGELWSSMTPMGILATPEDIGNTAAFLCSDASKVTTGALVLVDGGLLCE